MRIYLIRHGKAVAANPSLDNFRRYLTDTGKKDTRKMARFLAQQMGDVPVGIFISPLVRTQQTAEIYAEELRRVRAKDNVTSATLYALCRKDWEPVDDYLLNAKAVQRLEHICIVSHQPFLEAWLQLLTGTVLTFHQSGLAIVDYKRKGKSKLRAYIMPKFFEEPK